MRSMPSLRTMCFSLLALLSFGPANAAFELRVPLAGLAPLGAAAPEEPVPPQEPEPDISDAATCLEILSERPGSSDGIYRLNAEGQQFDVFCDMTTAGGGWTLIFAGDHYQSGAPALTFGSVLLRGTPLVTYSENPGGRPVPPNGLLGNFATKALMKGGSPSWQTLYGGWTSFDVLGPEQWPRAYADIFSGVSSESGRNVLYHQMWGWGWQHAGTVSASHNLVLWDTAGLSPNCGGAGVSAGLSCPTFFDANYGSHFDYHTYKELYLR